MKKSILSEIDLVARIARMVKYPSSVFRGIGDDAAVIKYTQDKYLLFTADMLIEGVDFTAKASPRDLGYKALGCSLSDIAAMAGIPRFALVSLGLPKERSRPEFIDGFYKGLLSLGRRFKVSIVGGDLSVCEKLVIDVCMVGEVKKNRLALRSGAKTGDVIFVSGSLGGSIYGRHLKFIPRIKEAGYLSSNYKINSMMDISDGLSLDLFRLACASSKGAVIYEGLIPVSGDAKSPDEALYMGEDLELLFTMPKKEAGRLLRNKGRFFKAIGEITDKRFGLKIITRDGKEKRLEPKGYQHF